MTENHHEGAVGPPGPSPAGKAPGAATGPLPQARSRLYLVDDQLLLREGLRELLHQTEDLVICGEAASLEEALQGLPGAKTDLVITELSLAGTNRLEGLTLLKSRHPTVPVLVLSTLDEFFFAPRALQEGARGYIMKHQAIRELKVAIRRILDGGIYVSQKVANRLHRSITHTKGGVGTSPIDQLSDREVEVFEMIGEGLGTGEISRRLRLSVKTIETYRSRIKDKLGLKDGAELIRQAIVRVHGAAFPA